MAEHRPMPPQFFDVLARACAGKAMVPAELPKSFKITRVLEQPGPSSQALAEKLAEFATELGARVSADLDSWTAAYICKHERWPRLEGPAGGGLWPTRLVPGYGPIDDPAILREARIASERLPEQLKQYPEFFEYRVTDDGALVHHGWYPLQDKPPHGRTHE